jgi:hypothetical protein
MDLRISPRGRFEIDNGRFSIVTDFSELLSQYLRAAITDQLRSDTFPSITASQISENGRLLDFKLEAQRRVVELVAGSPFAYDFDISGITVETQRVGQDSVLVSISYNNGSTNSVVTNYSINGGRLELEEELGAPYRLDGEVRLIEEEISASDFIEEVDVSCEPAGSLYICEEGAEPKFEDIIVPFAAIPEMDRIIAKNVIVDDTIYFSLGSRKSRHISIPYGGDIEDQSGLEDSTENAYDSIFLGSVLKNRGNSFKVTGVEQVAGDIRLIRYIPSVDDWLIEVSNENQVQVTVRVNYIEAIDICSTYFYQDAKTVTQVDNYSFPNESVRGRKYYRLNNVLSPGLYTIYYRGIVKPRYNGSIEEV